MKKVIFLCAIAVLAFSACQQGPVRYTQDSPEINTVKKLISNYNSKTYDTSMYADTSKTYYNTINNPMSPIPNNRIRIMPPEVLVETTWNMKWWLPTMGKLG